MWNFIKELRRKDHQRYLGGLDFFKEIYWSRFACDRWFYRSGKLGF